MTDFTGVDARLKWIKARRNALERSINYYKAHHPIEWVPKIADDRMSWTLSVGIDRAPPLTEWGLWHAGIMHDLRSVLDNVVWDMAHSGQTPRRPNRLEFPIVSDSAKWAQATGKISELPDEVKTYIESIQPFNGSSNSVGSALQILHELDIQNKHHAPVVTTVSDPQTIRNNWQVIYREDPDQTETSTLQLFPFRFEDGLVIWNQVVPKPIERIEHGEFSVEAHFVVMDELSRQFPVLGSIDYIIKGCTEVIEHLKTLDQ